MAIWVNYKRGVLDCNGSAVHEHGTRRMGEAPKRSALNTFNRRHRRGRDGVCSRA